MCARGAQSAEPRRHFSLFFFFFSSPPASAPLYSAPPLGSNHIFQFQFLTLSMTIISSTQPPRLLGLRYRTLFLCLQAANAVRFYICPDELNFQMPHFTHITMMVILLANAGAFFHGLDGSRQNWEVVQNCMVLVAGVYMFNVTVCLYYAYRANTKSEDGWFFVWDQLLHWHEAFVTSAMWTLARAEARYYETVEHLEKTAAEYNNATRPKKQRRRPRKSSAETEEAANVTARKYYH